MINRRLIVGFSLIMILLILSVGFVSAEENTTQNPIIAKNMDNATIFESPIEESPDYEEMMSCESDGDDPNGESSSEFLMSGGTNNVSIEFSVPDEILVNSSLYIEYYNTDRNSGNNDYNVGDVKVYIDDEYCVNLTGLNNAVSGWHMISKSLTLGNHTCNLVYEGDSYYAPFNKTFEFEVAAVIFGLDEKMYDYDYIRILLPDDATGTATITVNGSSKIYNVTGGTVRYYMRDLQYGKYNVEVTYDGNYGYKTLTRNITVDYFMELLDYDDEIDIRFDYYSYGDMTVLIDGKDIHYDKYNVDIPEDEPSWAFLPAPIYLSDYSISKGYHTFELIYGGDENRPAKSINATFYIKNSNINLNSKNLFTNTQYPIEFMFCENTTGNFSIYSSVDGENYTLIDCVNITDNTANINVSFEEFGTNYLKAAYSTNNGNYEFVQSFNVKGIEVTRWNVNAYGIYGWDARNVFMNSNSTDTITLEYGKNVVGNVSVYITRNGNSELFAEMELPEGGKMTISLPQIAYSNKAGTCSINVVWNTSCGFGSDSYDDIEVIDGTIIDPVDYQLLTKSLSVYYGEKSTFSVVVYGYEQEPVGKDQIVTFEIGNQTFMEKTDEGSIATLNIPTTLKPGNYTIKASFNLQTYEQKLIVIRNDNNGSDESSNLSDVKVTGAKDIAMYYGDSRSISLKVYDIYGKLVGKNQVVKIKIGKNTFSAKTNKNGVAKFKIPNTITPGKYTMTITYKNAKVTKKLIVKKVLTLKSIKVKKSAKKLILTATLKKGKKPIKNTRIIFKFNGKTYKKKTNSKGIAKVTIKKSVLKKLKKGKKVTYQATYIKDTIKKTAKVKK